jgi:hypothetical protein
MFNFALSRKILCFALLLTSPAPAAWSQTPEPSLAKDRIVAALANVTALNRPGELGLATVWDGNKFVQCRRLKDQSWRCEAAGEWLQPSLARVLTPERAGRLAALGWRQDPSFGNYVHAFDADSPASGVAEAIATVLKEAYDADVGALEVATRWVLDEACPPRNGPKQNLAGSINDASSMKASSIHACAYALDPGQESQPPVASAAELFARFGSRVTGEAQRLRVNLKERIYFGLQTASGYVQCAPDDTPPALQCEAVSPESWSVIASVLTPQRLEKLHAFGYQDPGRSPNFAKTYALAKFDDAAIARELLAVLFEVYGYDGREKPEFFTESAKR